MIDLSRILEIAKAELGTSESDTDKLERYFSEAGCDLPLESAWCAIFANAMLKRAGYKGTGSPMARSFLSWGVTLEKPVPGCLVVLKRGAPPSGHVGFFVEETDTHVSLLGGNQGDKVTISSYKKDRVLGYRAPDALEENSLAKQWKSMSWRSEAAQKSAVSMAKLCFSKKAVYKTVEDRTGIPWFIIAAVHSMEASCDFTRRIRDGSSLPAGVDWVTDASRELKAQNFARGTRVWTVEAIADCCERWNGLGYRKRGVTSPYIWSGSRYYTTGKFTADGVYDQTAVSKQIGILPLLKALTEIDPSFSLCTEEDKRGVINTITRSKSLPSILNALLVGILGFFTDFLQRAWEFTLWAIGILPEAAARAEDAKAVASRYGILLNIDWPKVSMTVVLATLAIVFIREFKRKRFEQ